MFCLFSSVSAMVIDLFESSHSFESNLSFIFLKNSVPLVHSFKNISKRLHMLFFHYLLILFL